MALGDEHRSKHR
jgi:hypothetical protein